MAAEIWSFKEKQWPATFGRKWIWTIFAEPSHHNRVVNLCVQLGITDLVILLNDSPIDQPVFSVRGGTPNVVKLAHLAQAAGVSVHLGTWLDPTETYVNACAPAMAELAKEAKAVSVILDLEGEWRKRIKNHAAFVAATVAPAFQGFPVPIGITSFAVLPKEVVPALAWAVQYHKGYGQPQAYSVYQGKKWQKSTVIQPDSLTSRAWKTWSPITRRLVCLEAAFGNPVPGRKIVDGEWAGKPWGITESIKVAAQRAEDDGFPDIGYWSEEALASSSEKAQERRAAIAEIKTTGKSLLERSWGRALAAGAAVVATAGGLWVAFRRKG